MPVWEIPCRSCRWVLCKQPLLQNTKHMDAGADGLFVHMMAVNERARSFYGKLGFVVEKEESSNEAHYRGRCLDGVEGRARTILMRDSLL